MHCSICGGTSFVDRAVLWDGLVNEWQISPEERAYVDRQQGTTCTTCGANLRSIALSNAICDAMNTSLSLIDFAQTSEASHIAILEINEAGTLSPILRKFRGHVLASYPEIDMHSMPYADGAFDLVVHSDTLEHVERPIHALAECRRVLRENGTLCFTIPTIVGRLSRSRAGLPKSFHGSAETGSDDFVVQTEFGADMWTIVLQAGFSAVSVNAVDFPSALALSARKKSVPIDTTRNRLSALGRAAILPERIVSVHFPKAAGSSLYTQFSTLLGDELALEWTHDPLTPLGSEPGVFPSGKRIVHGHFRAQRYASVDAYWVTFLREPIDNLISIYFFWKSLAMPGHELHARFLEEQPSIADFALFPGIQRLSSETYFGGFDMNRFDFIGFHETRNDDIRRLGQAINLPLDASHYVNKTNSSSEKDEALMDAALRRRLGDLLSDDLKFYDRMRDQF
jgi:SAM-dependent methyltransferase